MVLVQKREPISKNRFFCYIRGLLFEEYGAHGCFWHFGIFFAQEVERLVVEELDRARGKRSGFANERKHVCFVGEEDNAAEEALRFGNESRLDLANNSERAFAADEEIDRVHVGSDEVAGGVLASCGTRITRKRDMQNILFSTT